MQQRTEVRIEVSAAQYAALCVLNEGGDARVTLLELVDRVLDGVTRPGAWERGWLQQAFGPWWQARLERDPDCLWHQRPRAAMQPCKPRD